MSKKNQRIYFIGIGGISMSGLAKYCILHDYEVYGSDKVKTDITVKLKNLGAKITYGDELEDVKKSDLVVYTSAIDKSSKQLTYAINNKPLYKRSEFLGEIVKEFKNSIAVSGSHGKTTVSAMITEILVNSKLSPTAFIGGEGKFGNFLSGGKEYAVVEACEFKKNFLDIKPKYSVITNIDNDHLDSFNGIGEEIDTFTEFSKNTISFINVDDENARKVNTTASISFGIENKAMYMAKDLKEKDGVSSFTVSKYKEVLGRINLKIKGKYNVYNALASIAVCDELKVPFRTIKGTLNNFNNVKRRNEFLGYYNGNKCYGDYAHHPTEIKSLIEGYKKDCTVVFQPHTYSRTKYLFSDFTEVLKNVKRLLIYKTYPAREKFDEDGDAKKLYEELKRTRKNVYYADSESTLKNQLDLIKEKNPLIFVGAGDIYDIAKRILKNQNK